VLRNSAPLLDADGKTAKWIGVTIDITEQKRLESELRSSIAIRDQFLAVCSHELKTPLTLMELHAEAFRRKALRGSAEDLTPEMLGKYFERLSPHLKRLNHRINDMFDVSRIASGRLVLKLEEADLVALARAALANLAPQLEISGCELSLVATEPVYCRCDPIRVEQVLTNLIENALKYAKGKPIALRFFRDDAGSAFEVSDRGPGIADADRERIFGKFERAADGTGVSGLGLGLHIASEIVAAHGGTISVRSRLGEGATFVVRLPT
jgi:signal transduction histidine kinase